jgi:hypothetical protein
LAHPRWAMMNNHYHLLLETAEANLLAGMKCLLERVLEK